MENGIRCKKLVKLGGLEPDYKSQVLVNVFNMHFWAVTREGQREKMRLGVGVRG